MHRHLLPATCLATLLTALAPLQAHAQSSPQPGTEQLLRPQTKAYVLGHQARQPSTGSIEEYVPKGQSVQDWTEMLTVQDMPGSAHVAPRTFLDVMAQGWMGACPDGSVTLLREAVENGYPVAVMQMTCPNNPGTGKPEYTWMKGIQGGQRFHLVQKAFRFTPEREQLIPWVKYLSAVVVCDPKDSAHACPVVEAVIPGAG